LSSCSHSSAHGVGGWILFFAMLTVLSLSLSRHSPVLMTTTTMNKTTSYLYCQAGTPLLSHNQFNW
jgi:hypothetical protein